jgi:hypothetical protein
MSLIEAKRVVVEGPVDWLAAVILSWLIPIGLLPFVPVTYFTSLVFWGVPIVLLLPRFLQKSETGGRRRRAMLWTVTYILVAGLILDFLFGAVVLRFDPDPNAYVIDPLPAVGGTIPLEEVLFYLMGGIAIVLVYFWADEHWLSLYSVRKGRESIPQQGRLLFFSGYAATLGLVLWLAGVAVVSLDRGRLTVPAYYSLMVAVVIVPSIALFRNVKEFVNWKAFSFTCLWVLLTSCVWEVTLGLKRRWWGYEESAMIGVYVPDWGAPFSRYPIEALLVWLVITFTCVLTYEATKAYQYDPRRGMKTRLLGG